MRRTDVATCFGYADVSPRRQPPRIARMLAEVGRLRLAASQFRGGTPERAALDSRWRAIERDIGRCV